MTKPTQIWGVSLKWSRQLCNYVNAASVAKFWVISNSWISYLYIIPLLKQNFDKPCFNHSVLHNAASQGQSWTNILLHKDRLWKRHLMIRFTKRQEDSSKSFWVSLSGLEEVREKEREKHHRKRRAGEDRWTEIKTGQARSMGQTVFEKGGHLIRENSTIRPWTSQVKTTRITDYSTWWSVPRCWQ